MASILQFCRGQAGRHTMCPLLSSAQKQSACQITPPVTRAPSSRVASSIPSTTDANVACSRESTNVRTILAGALLPFLQQRWARADTIEGEPTDYLITGIFAVVIVALAIVTVGVRDLDTQMFQRQCLDKSRICLGSQASNSKSAHSVAFHQTNAELFCHRLPTYLSVLSWTKGLRKRTKRNLRLRSGTGALLQLLLSIKALILIQ